MIGCLSPLNSRCAKAVILGSLSSAGGPIFHNKNLLNVDTAGRSNGMAVKSKNVPQIIGLVFKRLYLTPL